MRPRATRATVHDGLEGSKPSLSLANHRYHRGSHGEEWAGIDPCANHDAIQSLESRH
ncbi:hypothetical protein E1A91_A01G051600v1 [Gossypium mustelinum]|uniref:Uncharacterized protein n=1 Tax=Gossypium mustelinum TaxID=34275 RepID=A0A5D3AEK3_GOSMU|nr:hypothetical protein E1A91_A01G051600v1 [Gossypium mustelinum]